MGVSPNGALLQRVTTEKHLVAKKPEIGPQINADETRVFPVVVFIRVEPALIHG